ncbi:hypothetical protein ACQR1I_11695 [Bradyrhizobium sp. HKCCYLS2038]|uniref:hypothetical protein n=1 Tax=unclassified Bradyrhizobium TaxID=2631580 RepID=UPI003EB820AF
MDGIELLQYERRVDLTKLRRLRDQLTEFETAIEEWEAILSDPGETNKHPQATQVLDIARRGKAVVQEAIEVCLSVLNHRDEKEEILKQINKLAD